MTPDKLGEVRFPIRASLVAVLIVGGLGLSYWWITGSLEKLVLFMAAMSAGAGAILGAFYSAKSVAQSAIAIEQNARALERENVRCSKALAFQFTSKWNDPAMYFVRDVVREALRLDRKGPEFKKLLGDKETNVIHFLNFLEEVAIAVESGDADERVLRDAFEGVVARAWNQLQDWIREERRVRNRPKIWIKTEQLAGKWV